MVAFTDDFTGADGQDLSARTGWTLVSGTASAAEVNAANQLKVGATTGYYSAANPGADQYAQAAIHNTGGSFGTTVRLSSGNDYYGLRNSGSWQLYKCVGGTFTLLGSYSATLVAGDVARLEVSGSSLTAKINGVTRIGPLTDTAHASGPPGIAARGSNVNPFLDAWESDALGGGGGAQSVTPSGLDDADVFGTAIVVPTNAVAPAGLDDADAFGTAVLSATYTITPTGYADPDTIGGHSVGQPGVTQDIAPSGLEEADAFGALALLATNALAPAGVGDADGFGTAALTTAATVAGTGFADPDAFGAPTVSYAPPPQAIPPGEGRRRPLGWP